MSSKREERSPEDSRVECCSQHGNPKIQNETSEDPNLNNNIESKSNVLSNGQSSKKFPQDVPSPRGKVATSNHVRGSDASTVPKFADPTNAQEDKEMRNNVDYGTKIEKCPSKVPCSSESSPDVDGASSGSYTFSSALNNIGSSIGSTSHGTCGFLRPKINSGAAGPRGFLKRAGVERRDSSSGNEGDMSDGEDYCIYTYKGNDEAPTQRPDQVQARENGELVGHQSGRSSPEMDFLEMDFDPGPSCEQDTGDSDLASINEDIQNIALDNVEADLVLLNDLSCGKNVSLPRSEPETERNVSSQKRVEEPQPSYSNAVLEPGCSQPWQSRTGTGTKTWEASNAYRHSPACPLQQSYGYHGTSGDLISPGDNGDVDPEIWPENSAVPIPENSRKINLTSNLYHRMMAKKLMLNKQTAFNQSGDSNLESEICNEKLDGLLPVEKMMLWTEQEAISKQVTQIGTSACGAAAAINALFALEVPFTVEVLVKGVATKLRETGAPLPRYLSSRSSAGATHRDIARGIFSATNGSVVTKFFAFYPERKVSLTHWLHYWISRGAAPIATLNLQHCGEGHDIPDAWHHQMIFGVGQSGIYMTNPLQCMPEQILWHQLVSPSVLLIRQADVLAHWNESTDLIPLMNMDHTWRKMNVLGQVVNLIRETMLPKPEGSVATPGVSHIRIPASYTAGITLVMRSDSVAASELLHAEQLPLL